MADVLLCQEYLKRKAEEDLKLDITATNTIPCKATNKSNFQLPAEEKTERQNLATIYRDVASRLSGADKKRLLALAMKLEGKTKAGSAAYPASFLVLPFSISSFLDSDQQSISGFLSLGGYLKMATSY